MIPTELNEDFKIMPDDLSEPDNVKGARVTIDGFEEFGFFVHWDDVHHRYVVSEYKTGAQISSGYPIGKAIARAEGTLVSNGKPKLIEQISKILKRLNNAPTNI